MSGCILLSGCSGLSKTDREYQKSSFSLEGTTITLAASSDWIKEAEMQLGTNFEAATGIQVVYELYPDDIYLSTLFERLDSGDAPDIFLTQSGFALASTYNIDKYAIELSDEKWSSSYDSLTAKETSVNGVNYGMTYFDNTTDYYIVYNKKIFEKAGINKIPENYKDFVNCCRSISYTGVVPIYEPMADGWHQTMLFAETGQLFANLSPELPELLNTNQCTFAECKDMLTSLEQIRELSQSGYFGSDFASDAYSDAIGYMASGEYAMCMLRAGAISSIIENDLNNGYVYDDFGLMLLPIGDCQILNVHPTAPTHFISQSSSNQKAAKLYLSYLAEADNIQYMIDHSDMENLPFNAGQHADYNKTTSEFLQNFDKSSTGLVLQDEITYFNEQWGEISADILEMCLGSLSPEKVLQRIDSRRATLAIAADDPDWK